MEEGRTLVEWLSGVRAQSSVAATKGTRRKSRTLVKPPYLRGNADRALPFELYHGICLTTEEKPLGSLSQGSRKVPAGHDSFYQSGGRDCRDRLCNYQHSRLALRVGQVNPRSAQMSVELPN
jgi:hypothetical protein